MYIRKLVKSGLSSLVVALPKSWIKDNSMKGGDEIYIEEIDNYLRLTADIKKKGISDRIKTIDVDNKPLDFIFREITCAYLNDYMHIVLKGETLPKKIKSYKKRIAEFIALEVVEEEAKKITARSFLNIHDIDLQVLMRRMDNIVRSMIADTKSVDDKELLLAIGDRDRELNKLHYVVIKILKSAQARRDVQESLNLERLNIMKYWELNMMLEKIGDRIKYIASEVSGLKKSEHGDFLSLFTEISAFYVEVMNAFYSNSTKDAIEASIKREALMKKIEDYDKKSQSASSTRLTIDIFNMLSHIGDITKIVTFIQDE